MPIRVNCNVWRKKAIPVEEDCRATRRTGMKNDYEHAIWKPLRLLLSAWILLALAAAWEHTSCNTVATRAFNKRFRVPKDTLQA